MKLRPGMRGVGYAFAHPRRTLRFASYLAAGDGTALGHWLRNGLSPEQRRRLGATALAVDDVTFEFEGDGFHWAVPSGDPISTGLLATGDYSGRAEVEPLVAWLDRYADRAGHVVVDVGANVGTTTVPLAAAGFRVIAVEPVPSTFAFLRRNVETNGVASKVECVQVAIAARASSVTMSAGRWHGISRVVDAPTTSTIDVEAMGLSDLVRSQALDAMDLRFVWCDAEGSEAEVIETGAALWKAGVPLFAEFGHVELTAVAARHFAAFVPGREIFARGLAAAPRPISALAAFDGFAENVLYLPDGADGAVQTGDTQVSGP